MGTQNHELEVGTTAPVRWTSWRDTLVADYEIQQARLRVLLQDAQHDEEHL